MKRSRLRRLAAITAGLMLAAIGTLNSRVGTRRASASTLTVTNTADSGPGSLRDTIGAANPGDTIMFNLTLPATIILTSGEISILNNLTITGPGQVSLTISGNFDSRIFDIATGRNLTLSGLTIANGSDPSAGGAVNNGGTLSVTNCTFTGSSTAGTGGGIDNNPGAILSVSACIFNSNSAAEGGAILNEGTGTLNVQTSTFGHNSANFGNAGAISNKATGSLNVAASTFNNNSAEFGGSIATEGTSLIAGSTFGGNTASHNGGAILIDGGTTTVVNCTFSGNAATNQGGAIDIAAGATVANCTLSGNSAGSGSGGGIFVTSLVSPPPVNLQNNIIAHSTTGGDCVNQGTATVNSHNLIQDGSCSPMLSGNPMLGPLQNNGGPTLTMALLAGSPAIDQGDDSVLGAPLSLTADGRGTGFPRKSGLHVDIGAFELQQVGPSFDTCLKDNSSGNLIQWNSTTGQYQFTRCSDNFTLSGTGTVAVVNGIRTLTDFKADRRIRAGFNKGQLTGNATIYLKIGNGVWQVFQVNDTNPSAVCKC